MQSPRPCDPGQVAFAPVLEPQARSVDEIHDGLGHQDLTRTRGITDPSGRVHGDPGDVVAAPLDLTRVHAAAHLEAEKIDRPGDVVSAADTGRTARTSKPPFMRNRARCMAGVAEFIVYRRNQCLVAGSATASGKSSSGAGKRPADSGSTQRRRLSSRVSPQR